MSQKATLKQVHANFCDSSNLMLIDLIGTHNYRHSYNLAECIGIGKKQISQSTHNERRKISRDTIRKTLIKTVVKNNPKADLKPKSISLPNTIKPEVQHLIFLLNF